MATVRFYAKGLKGQQASVMFRFTIDRDNRFKLATGERLPLKYWDKKLQQAKTSYDDHLLFNESLTKIKASIIQLYRDNKQKSIDELQEMARAVVNFGQTEAPQKKSLYPILSKCIEFYKKEFDPKTAAKFVTLEKKHLKAFNPNLEIHKLDNNFLDRFKEHLYKVPMVDTSVDKVITNLSTFLTWAMERGHQVHRTGDVPTHQTWKKLNRQPVPISLTMAELTKLEALTVTQAMIDEKLPPKKHGRREYTAEALTAAQVYLIMECRTCQRISDLKSFDPKDLDGMVWVNRVEKGARLVGRVVRIPFNADFIKPAYDLLLKYNFKLPEVSEQKLNKNMKTVCMLAGIDKLTTRIRWKRNEKVEEVNPKYKFVSTHTGRKTFITIGLQHMQPRLVKAIAGVSYSTLKHYEGEVEDQVLIDGLNSIPNPIMKAS